MSTMTGCNDSADDFNAVKDNGRVKMFRYGNARTDIIDPGYECAPGRNCAYRGSKEEIAARTRLNSLIKRVVISQNCTQDIPKRKMLGKK